MKQKRRQRAGILLIILIVMGIFLYLAYRYNLIPQKVYSGEDFGIQRIYSSHDEDNDGVDDYTDILLGARLDAQNKPNYKSNYYAGGYPPEDEGVCTDVIWRAFNQAGYQLKDMVDADILQHLDLYPRVEGQPDGNIDFRRVPNLKVFFDNNASSYTLDPYEIAEWQPGDIVIFGNNKHIGIISDKRNSDGIPYLIHNAGQPVREEDGLIRWYKAQGITGHYRYEK
jgi:uncharacterized protein YijF (DUF1287 family)